MEICPSCHFLIPEGATTCRVCHDDPASVVLEQPVIPEAPVRRKGFGAGRGSNARLRRRRRGPIGAVCYRIGAWYDRNGPNVRLTVVAVVGAAATTMIVAPTRDAAPPAPVADIAPVDAYDWRPFQPEDGALRVDLPSEPMPYTVDDGRHYRVDLGGVRLLIGSFVLDEPAADPLAQLRAMAARSGDALRTPVQELGVTTLSWGPALDVRLDDDDATVLLRFTIAGERLYVLEGDLLPELAADPNSRARAAYDRMVETFRPLA